MSTPAVQRLQTLVRDARVQLLPDIVGVKMATTCHESGYILKPKVKKQNIALILSLLSDVQWECSNVECEV